MARYMIAAALALCALACFASAQETYDSTGRVVYGFTILSNVTGYMRSSLDACEIADLAMASPPNFERIYSIYVNGSNSFRPDGRTARVLAAWASGSHATDHAYYNNAAAALNDTRWIANMMMAVANPNSDLTPAQKAIIAVNTASLQLPLSYMMAELSAIADEIDPEGTNVTASGAPHALDEAFGVYVGAPSECSPFNYFLEASEMFGTMSSCNSSAINEMIIEEFIGAQATTLNGNVAQFEEHRDNIFRYVQVALIQNVLGRARMTEMMQMDVARAEMAAMDANAMFLQHPDEEHMMAAVAAHQNLQNATMFLGAAKADAYSLFTAMIGFVQMHDPMAAGALNHFLGLDTPVARGHFAQVSLALMSLFPAMGITPEMVGTYGAMLEGCSA